MTLVERLRRRYVMSMFASQAMLYDTMNVERAEAADRIEQLEAKLAVAEEFAWPSCRYRIEQLEAENAALREDAERYRTIKFHHDRVCNEWHVRDGNGMIPDDLDAAIDAARSQP